MKKLSTLVLIPLLALTLSLNRATTRQASPQPNSPQAETSKVALLIGIDKYPHVDPLNGCVNDVRLMKQLLLGTFQFKEQEIDTLINEQATKANIIKHFNEFLVAKAQRDGQALFYYSGHGSRVTDLGGDEPDGFDESIVPYDATRDRQSVVNDLPDDSLGLMLAALTQKCKNVTVIFDCCLSGSGIRGLEAYPKQIKPLVLNQPRSRSAARPVKDGPTGFLPPNPNYVFIAACRDSESAYQSGGRSGLTAALCKELFKKPKATYRAIMYEVTEKVAAAYGKQHPQIEGPRRDEVVFGSLGEFKKFVEVAAVENQRVKLKAGVGHNVTVGSVYDLYKPGTTNQKDATRYVGRVKITKVGTFSSWANIEEKKATIRENAAAFEVLHDYGDLRLAVRLDLSPERSSTTPINAMFADSRQMPSLVKMAAPDENYDVKIRLNARGDSLVLERPNLTRLKTLPNHGDTLENYLTSEARYKNLLTLENPQSNLQVDLIVDRWKGVTKPQFQLVQKLNPLETAGGQRLFLVGDLLKITIKNNSSRAVFPYVFDLGTDGSVSLLYPPVGAQDSPLAAGAAFEMAAAKITPPEGLDALKLIATTEAVDFSNLEQTAFRATNRSKNSPLQQLINSAWQGRRGNEKTRAVAFEDWATETFSLMIKFKPDK